MLREFRKIFKQRSELSVRYDAKHAAVWCYFNPKDRPRYSLKMLHETLELQQTIIEYFEKSNMNPKIPIHYLVVASQSKDIFNYGGDLQHFINLIENKDKDGLLEYAKLCIDNIYLTSLNLNLPITTISLVQGAALGGGLEVVLSTTVVVAEEKATMGFPEIRFNLFPGMGAYSLLTRMHGIPFANELMTNGKIYTAKELYDMGIVHHIVKNGTGIEKIEQFMKKHNKRFHGMQAIQKVEQVYKPICYDEMINITKVWVDTALTLTKSDLKTMQRFVSAQNTKNINYYKVRTHQDRRIYLGEVSFPLVDSDNNVTTEDRREEHRRKTDRRKVDRRKEDQGYKDGTKEDRRKTDRRL